MRKTSPAQLALIDLPSDELGGTPGADLDRDVLEAARADAARLEASRAEAAERARREAQAIVNVRQCQALLESIARVPPAGAAVPAVRPSARPRRRSYVEEGRVRQLAELYAAFERAQGSGNQGSGIQGSAVHGTAMPGAGEAASRQAAANDDRRQRGRGSRVA